MRSFLHDRGIQLLIASVASCVLLATVGCERGDSTVEERFEGPIMGTQYHVTVVSEVGELNPDERQALQQAVVHQLDTVNSSMSTYIDESELSRFNASSSVEPFEVSSSLLEVAREAQRIHRWSRGAFDPTVGPLVDLWGFGPSQRAESLPGDDEVETLLQLVGYDKLVVTSSPATLRKLNPQLELDLSAIAKGYAVDLVAEELEQQGYSRYLVEVGGELRTAGVNARGEAWRIGIERPETGRRELQDIIALSGLSLATSGDYRNFYEIDGQRYSHTLDPRTGRPVTHPGASVTVISDRCISADGYATALLALGPDDGFELAVEEELAALFLIYHEGAVLERPTPAFQSIFHPEELAAEGQGAEP
ncbi:MAG: FAD:protein FMN transferase [Acidobacteriota bacterium]